MPKKDDAMYFNPGFKPAKREDAKFVEVHHPDGSVTFAVREAKIDVPNKQAKQG